MEEIIHVPEEQSETGNLTEYTESVVECSDSVPEVAKPLIGSAGRLLNRIEKMLYSAPAFVGAVKAVYNGPTVKTNPEKIIVNQIIPY